MKPRLRFAAIASATLVMSLSRPGSAQTGHSANTVEAVVAEASLIVRATVSDVKMETVNDRPTKGWKRTIVTLKVSETLKGKPVDIVTFGEGNYGPDLRYEAWKNARTELLWFFGPNATYGKPATVVEDEIQSRYPLQNQLLVRLGPGTPVDNRYTEAIMPMFLMDLTVVKGPDAIVKAVRSAIPYPSDQERKEALISRSELPPRGHSLGVPHALMARSGRVGDWNMIHTPIDRRLEKLARGLIKSPGVYLPTIGDYGPDKAAAERYRRFDEDQLRAEGAKALRYFKSDENVALLKSMLADPASVHVSNSDPNKPNDGFREYFVRKAAYETLKGWDVVVAEPIIRVPDGDEK